ncbi:MAG: aldo/keto reductase [Deltaproteobacteria bacterium]|nr:aldo/keto reductase [Deltaproteobacteria bacterium]MBW2305403.1 aldo/keto reductase [Deltaproteobacteria bacterium]
MKRIILGRTGASVSIIGMGGGFAGVCAPDEDEAFALVHRALDMGLNYLDTAHIYGYGESERRIGMVMKTRRKDAFLVTKLRERDSEGAEKQLDKSLKRLNTDYVDLLHLHGVCTMEDLDAVTRKGGALETIVKAREAGKARFLGVSNHSGVDVLLESMRRFDFDVAFYSAGPLDYLVTNFQDKAFVPHVTEALDAHNRGKIGMKVAGHGLISHLGDEAVRFGLSEPVHVLVVGIDSMKLLVHLNRLADEFIPMDVEEKRSLIEKVKEFNRPEQLWWRSGMSRQEAIESQKKS